jgi:hypothetical protein
MLLFYGLLIFCFSYPCLKNTDIKVGGLITTLIYLFNLWSLKLFYKHFQLKTKHSQIMKLTAPQIDHLFTLPALCRMVRFAIRTRGSSRECY